MPRLSRNARRLPSRSAIRPSAMAPTNIPMNADASSSATTPLSSLNWLASTLLSTPARKIS